MIAEVISIGDELTSGQRLDTNSQWLSQQLGDLGVKTIYHTTVADDLMANVRVFAGAVDRADLIVASGGLGPTADDLTREVIAKVAGVELLLDEPSLSHIRSLFTRHKREMPERNNVQAMFPKGSRPIPNDKGTAPGIDMLIAGSADDHFARIFALPGVPAEMKEMFVQTLAPAILAMQPKPRVIRHRQIKCFGVGESQLEAMLPDLIARGREPSVGITVHAATITLRITAAATTPDECYAAMEPTVATIRQCLGDLIFGEEDDELQDAVVRLLGERKQTLSTVEFGTRGVLANWLSEAADHTDVFIASQVFNNPPTLSTAQKQRAGVDTAESRRGPAPFAQSSEQMEPAPFSADETLVDFASKEYVEDLARRWRDKTGCDYTLAIGEFPADAGVTDAPTYYFALATADRVIAASSTLVSHESIWKPRAAKQALNLLRLHLLR